MQMLFFFIYVLFSFKTLQRSPVLPLSFFLFQNESNISQFLQNVKPHLYKTYTIIFSGSNLLNAKGTLSRKCTLWVWLQQKSINYQCAFTFQVNAPSFARPAKCLRTWGQIKVAAFCCVVLHRDCFVLTKAVNNKCNNDSLCLLYVALFWTHSWAVLTQHGRL